MGRVYFKSGHVQKMFDCETSSFYIVKCRCMASYDVNKMYHVTVTLSKVCKWNVGCKAKQSQYCASVSRKQVERENKNIISANFLLPNSGNRNKLVR